MSRKLAKTRSGRAELIAFKRRIKSLIVDAAIKGWLTPEQAQFALRRLALRHE